MSPQLPPSRLEELSHAQGGSGVGLRLVNTLTQLAKPISLGTTPGSGTGCTVFLATNSDPAYDNAQIFFNVKIFGRLAQFNGPVVISPADNAAQLALEYTVYGCAADEWEVLIQLNNGVTPAVPLVSSLTAFGWENIQNTGGGGGTYTGTFPIVVTGTVISIDPSAIPWQQTGGVGGTIQAVDPTANIQAAGGSVLGTQAVGLSNGGASGPTSFATGTGSSTQSGATDAFAAAGGTSVGPNDSSFGVGALADGGSAFAANAGNALQPDAAAFNVGTANALQSFAANGAQANATGAAAFGQAVAIQDYAFAAGIPGLALLEVGNDVTGTAVLVSSQLLGFFGVTPVAQQVGGPATASPIYGATEQGMLNAVYDALQAYGLLT